MFPRDYELWDELRSQSDVLRERGSAVIAPDGSYVVEPVYGKETLNMADIETDRTVEESLTLDTGGHYSRPDLFELLIHRRGRKPTGKT